MEAYYLLDWDTRFFGYKIVCIELNKLDLKQLNHIIKELRDKDCKLAYCFADPEDKVSNSSMVKCSGLLVDEKVTYSALINTENNYPVPTNVISYDLKYASEKLKSLTLQSGVYSRFKIDTNFCNNEFDKLYIEWIEKSVSRELADEILISKENNKIQGFITLKIERSKGLIGLLAVDEEYRGKSIGKKLLFTALMYFREKGIKSVEVVTQKGNYIACRFYESCGFEVCKIVNVYHLWIR